MSNLTPTQIANIAILRSQGDSDEQIAVNLHLDLADVAEDAEPDVQESEPEQPRRPLPSNQQRGKKNLRR